MRRIRDRAAGIVMPVELATFVPTQWSDRPIGGHPEWSLPGADRSPACIKLHRQGRRWRQARARWLADQGVRGPDAVVDAAADAQVDQAHAQRCGCSR